MIGVGIVAQRGGKHIVAGRTSFTPRHPLGQSASLLGIAGASVNLGQRELDFRVVRRDFCRSFQLRPGFIIFLQRCKQQPQALVRRRIQRHDLQVLAVGGNGVVVLSRLLQLVGQLAVRLLAVRIDFNLLLESLDRLLMAVQPCIGAPQRFPCFLMLRILIGDALEKIGGGLEVPPLQCAVARFH